MIAHNHEFILSVGHSVKSKRVRQYKSTWQGLTSRFAKHDRTTDRVNGKYFCTGTFVNNNRSKANHRRSGLIALDYDSVPVSITEFLGRVRRATRAGFIAYSTFRHTPEAPRLRILLPLNRTVTTNEYEVLVDIITERIGLPFDRCSRGAEQPMFFPKAPKGAEVFSHSEDTALLDTDSLLVGHTQNLSTHEQITTKERANTEAEDTDFGLLDYEQILLPLLLEAYPATELEYDKWFEVVAATYHLFRGSHEARNLCQEWSAKCHKHDPKEIPRIWPFIKRKTGEKKLGLTRLRERIDERGGPNPEAFAYLVDLAGDATQESYGKLIEGVSSAPEWLIDDKQRGELKRILYERLGDELGKDERQIASDLRYQPRTPDRLQRSRDAKTDYEYRLHNASDELELHGVIEEIAECDDIDRLIHLPELFATIISKRRELGLPTVSESQIRTQIDAMRMAAGKAGNQKKPAYMYLVQKYSAIDGWYQCKDSEDLILSREHTPMQVCDVSLRSHDMAVAFRREFYESHKNSLDDKQINNIQSTLEALLIGQVPVHKVHVRAATLENGDIILDSHWDGGVNVVVHADGSGISFTTEAKARFRRPVGAQPLPAFALDEPYEPDLMWQFWPGITDAEKLLVTARNIEIYRTDTPTPLLAVFSPLPGVGKTYRLKANSEIFDPCKGNLIVRPRNTDDLAMALNQFSSVTIDNLTELDDEYQNLLCNAVTDGKYVKRKNYTDSDTFTAHVKCDVAVTSINESAITKHDLWSRTITVSPQAIPKGQMLQEGEWRSALEACKGRILATHLRDMSKVLKRRADLDVRPVSRLSDYEITGEALRQVWGYKTPFAQVLQDNQTNSKSEAHAGNTFIEELIDMTYERGQDFLMPASTVLNAVERHWQFRHDKLATAKMDGKPKSPAAVGKMLEQMQSYLNEQGVSFDRTRKSAQRLYRIYLNDNAVESRKGNNPNAGKNTVTSGEYDLLLPLTKKGRKKRTDEEWEAIFRELDDNSDE